MKDVTNKLKRQLKRDLNDEKLISAHINDSTKNDSVHWRIAIYPSMSIATISTFCDNRRVKTERVDVYEALLSILGLRRYVRPDSVRDLPLPGDKRHKVARDETSPERVRAIRCNTKHAYFS